MPAINDATLLRSRTGRVPSMRSGRAKSAAARVNISLTVGQLIAQLQKADPDAPVVIAGQYGGFAGVEAVASQPLRLNVNGLDGFGAHDLPGDGETPDVVALAVLGLAAGI